MSLGIRFRGVHRSYILSIKGLSDQPPKRTTNNRHVDVENKPPIHRCGLRLRFEGIVNMNIDRRAQRMYVEDVVKIDRTRRSRSPTIPFQAPLAFRHDTDCRTVRGMASHRRSERIRLTEATSARNSAGRTTIRTAPQAERKPPQNKIYATVIWTCVLSATLSACILLGERGAREWLTRPARAPYRGGLDEPEAADRRNRPLARARSAISGIGDPVSAQRA